MNSTSEKRALEGIRVLSTRPQRQFAALAEKLSELGAQAVSHPVIEIEPAADQQRVQECLHRIADYRMVVFLSRNAAIEFGKVDSDLADRSRQNLRVGAIGQGTRRELESRGIKVHFLPEDANSQSMAERIIEFDSDGDEGNEAGSILIIRADRGSDVLASRLADAGLAFEELKIYRHVDVTSVDSFVLTQLAAGEFDWVTVTSSAIAKNVARLFGESLEYAKVVSISPQTTAAAIEAGLAVHATAETYSIDGLIAAIVKQLRESKTNEPNK